MKDIEPKEEHKAFAKEISDKFLCKDWSLKSIFTQADSIEAMIAHKLAKENWKKWSWKPPKNHWN